MKLDVYLSPTELVPGDVAGRTVVVIDLLRATSSMVVALSAGAKAIYPVVSVEEALRLATTLGRSEVLLCGERRCLPVEGFDLGNSPAEYTPERVGGRTLVMTTTNGTAALALAAGGARVLAASLLNLGAVADELAFSAAEPVLLCAGREGRFALEDAVCAGLLAQRLCAGAGNSWETNDGAKAALVLARALDCVEELLPRTEAGKAIAAAGLGADLAVCAQLDLHSVVPLLRDRQLVAAP